MTMSPRNAKSQWDEVALLTLGASASVALMAVSGVVLDNPGEVLLLDLVRPTVAALGLAIILPAVLFAAGMRTVALAVPVFLFAFFKFSGFMGAAEFAGLYGINGFYAALAGFGLLTVVATDSIRRREQATIAKGTFCISVAIATGSMIAVAMTLSQSSPPGQAATDKILAEAPSPAFKRADLPDIIYIVPDRYGSAATLKKHFNHDNEPFFAELEKRGFFVDRDARSNYAKTVSSLSSSLNMADLSALNAAMGAEETNRYPLYRLIREQSAQRILRGAGYDYHHLGNWWGPSRRSPYADAQYIGSDTFWSKATEFEKAVMRLTPIAPIATDGAAAERAECPRLHNQLDYIAEARAKSDKPIFLFSHLTIPHDPITMDADGNCIEHVYYPGQGTKFSDYQKAYAGYVTYLNKRLLDMFDRLKASDEKRSLIFVVQADEGPYPKRLQEDGGMVMQDFTDDEIREKFGIINAIYWDAELYGAPYLTETPINNWRIILSKISGDEIPLIEDERSYLMRSDSLVYDNLDVTHVLATQPRRLHASADSRDAQQH